MSNAAILFILFCQNGELKGQNFDIHTYKKSSVDSINAALYNDCKPFIFLLRHKSSIQNLLVKIAMWCAVYVLVSR